MIRIGPICPYPGFLTFPLVLPNIPTHFGLQSPNSVPWLPITTGRQEVFRRRPVDEVQWARATLPGPLAQAIRLPPGPA